MSPWTLKVNGGDTERDSIHSAEGSGTDSGRGPSEEGEAGGRPRYIPPPPPPTRGTYWLQQQQQQQQHLLSQSRLVTSTSRLKGTTSSNHHHHHRNTVRFQGLNSTPEELDELAADLTDGGSGGGVGNNSCEGQCGYTTVDLRGNSHHHTNHDVIYHNGSGTGTGSSCTLPSKSTVSGTASAYYLRRLYGQQHPSTVNHQQLNSYGTSSSSSVNIGISSTTNDGVTDDDLRSELTSRSFDV